MKIMHPFAGAALNAAPRFFFVLLYLFAAVLILALFNGWGLPRTSEPSGVGLALGISCWALNLVAIMYYTVLPDLALRKLHKHGRQVRAEILECGYRSSVTLLQLRFTNLAGTPIVRHFSLSLTGNPEKRDQLLQITREAGQHVLPLWLNTRLKQPAFGFAYQTGRRSWPELRLGLILVGITLLSLITPAVFAVLRDPQLMQDPVQLVLTHAPWPVLPLVNTGLLWMYFSHAAGPTGPTKYPVDLFHVAGVPAKTESFQWRSGGYSGDVPVYKMTLRYRDAAGQRQEARFQALGHALSKEDEAEEEQALNRIAQQRPILYLEHHKEHILFQDHDQGLFM